MVNGPCAYSENRIFTSTKQQLIEASLYYKTIKISAKRTGVE